MKLVNPKITILIGVDYTTIELHDSLSGVTLADIKLTPEQLSSALSRVGYTPCEAEVHNLDKVGKKQEIKKHTFDMPEKYTYEERNALAYKLALETCPEGWEPDNYFNSQDSFSGSGANTTARCTIRRWITPTDIDPLS